MPTALFPLAEYWWFYAGFVGLIVLLLALDLSAHRKVPVISMRRAALWTALWVSVGLSFSAVIYLFAAHYHPAGTARQLTFEYLAGYLIEESLSVDNMFVFALVFRYFSLNGEQQHRVLFYGILGAMVFRGAFVAAGSALIQFQWVVIAFGIFLVLSGARMAFASEKKFEPGKSHVIRMVRRVLPVADEMDGHHFIVRKGRVLYLTPLMVVLLVLETTDVLFAIDSVPAVFAVTKEPLVVYTSNVFAILGLRAMYFLLAGALDLFHLLKYGLAVVLVFVGVKMAVLDELAGGRLPIGFSLTAIAAILGVSIVLSLAFPVGFLPRRGSLHWMRTGAGAAFVLLCCGSLGMAMGYRPAFLAGIGLEAIRSEWLIVSGLCHGVCASILFWPKRS